MKTRGLLRGGKAILAAYLGATCVATCDPLADSGSKVKVPSVVPMKAQAFALPDVRLLGGPFKHAMEVNQSYLLLLETDRLLHTFRLNAGLPSAARPLGGWEEPKCELRGHFVGHYLSACALMFASTGDERLREKGNAVVAGLAECQAKFPSGYLSAYPEEFFDRVEARQPVWAPYYTLHKIYAGLLDTYVYCDNQQALDVCKKFADWAIARNSRLTDEQMQKMLGEEHGGMNECLANLYGLTGEKKYLDIALRFNHLAVISPASHRIDKLTGLHANTQIPKFIGTAREYELTGQDSLKTASLFFWESVAKERSYVIGGHSDGEYFFPVTDFAKHLSADTAETCNTYNMLKLTRHLFAWEPSAATMDFYERALYNHILASQDPREGMFVYLMSLKPGHFKTYSTPENSFWCCVGTGIENHAKYADTIFMHSADTLYVNLFIPAELTWKEKGLVVRQETSFPASDTIKLRFQCAKPVKLTVKVRRPYWAVEVAGKVGADGYLTYDRVWRDGDTLDVRLPMALRTETLPGTPNIVALLYGPVVLAGELGTAGMPSSYSPSQTALNNVPSPDVPVLVCDAKDLLSRVEPIANQPLHFRTRGIGQPQDISLIPFWQMHHQRYSVYWKRLSAADWQAKKTELAAMEAQRKAYEIRLVDEVQPGEQQPEIDHQQQGERTQSGSFQDRKWRDANQGGWFSYAVKVLPAQPMTLVCTYWGDDAGAREFDILVDGEKAASQKLNHNRPGEFFEATYPVPEKFTHGKDRVTVRFQAQPGRFAGGLFGLRVLKP